MAKSWVQNFAPRLGAQPVGESPDWSYILPHLTETDFMHRSLARLDVPTIYVLVRHPPLPAFQHQDPPSNGPLDQVVQ